MTAGGAIFASVARDQRESAASFLIQDGSAWEACASPCFSQAYRIRCDAQNVCTSL